MPLYLIIIVVAIAILVTYMIQMPGDSYSGALPALEKSDLETAERIANHVTELCKNPMGRNFIEQQGLAAARKYITEQFISSGYRPGSQEYQIADEDYANIEAQLTGTAHPGQIILVGAHYDAVPGAPGANDNGTGIAALLELADRFRNKSFPRTLRFVAFVNEEPPNFMTGAMGSYVYAKSIARKKENIIAMFSLETIGYFRDERGTQHYPPPLSFFYPDKGNFIAFVGNLRSRPLVIRSIRMFRENATFPSEGIAAPGFIPGISWSDHWSFWKLGYPAIMITDTAPYRYTYYHSAEDPPDKVDYKKMVYVVNAIEKMLEGFLR